LPDPDLVAHHYTHGDLLDAIRAGLQRLGKSPDTVSVEDLAPVDEFHIGGRAATEALFSQIEIDPSDHVLDVGCGLGGASRFVASRYRCRVTGVDLTREYVDAGNALCAWVGLASSITLEQGNATALGYPEATFDKAYMLHVGMNITDKARLMGELHRVLKPGGVLAIYDVMRVGTGDLVFPVPWATRASESAVSSPAEYRAALEAAGFRVTREQDRHQFATDFFARLRAATTDAAGPPPLGLQLLMGENAPTKVANMIANVSNTIVAPVELIAEKGERGGSAS
jgi:ubiquinone/menaquinone biosynthesis C-methylase UbiE